MKKKVFFVSALIFVFSIFLVGCSSELEKHSKNLTNYSIVINFDNTTKSLTANQKVDYKNNSSYVLDRLCFHLYPNAFREGAKQKVIWLQDHLHAYPNGTSYGRIEIEDVFLKGEKAEFTIGGMDENILEVPLIQKLFPDDRVLIEINFKVYLPNINHRFGWGDTAINVANFYPIACVFENGEFKTDPYSPNGDPFYSDMSNYNVKITYDELLVLASTGLQLKTTISNNKKTTEIKAEVVRDFAFVFSEKFKVVSQKSNETMVYYYYADDENFQQSLQTSVLALETFEDLFGDYPYPTLSVVQTNFVHGGMEYPNLVYISDDLANYETYTNVIVHEIAHQWWYNMVGSNAYANPWQDEGLTDYSTALFYEKNPQYNITLKSIIENGVKTYSAFVEVYGSLYSKVNTTMKRSLHEYKNSTEYVFIAYVKSMLMFDSLREFLGDEVFFEGLRTYFKDFKFKNAQYYDLIASFEKASKTDLESFFDAWLDGKIIIMQFRWNDF